MKKSKPADDSEGVKEKTTDEAAQSAGSESNESQESKGNDGIRRIIKLGPEKNNEENTEESKTLEVNKEETSDVAEQIKEDASPVSAEETKKSVEKENPSSAETPDHQVLLQNLKDFDFQLKKNQEEIKNLSEKVESISKDLDDLVSLYEIVSEQMNPFVGLSKVTKQRLEALENFTSEVQSLKERLEELELSIGKTPPVKTETADRVEVAHDDVNGENLSDADAVVERALDVITFEEKIDDVIDGFLRELM